jgi:protein-tyrosine phosphatase
MIDLHCHLLPGVDDGAADLDEALAMARRLRELGFSAVCCTPHLPWSSPGHSPAELDAARAALAAELERAGVALGLHRGAEHHVSELAERLVAGRLVAYPGGDSFLLEFSTAGFPPQLDQLLFRLQVKGLVPVLAHVERYPEVQADAQALADLRRRGCRVTINLTSLAGAWDRAARKAARSALRAGLVDAAATDLHAAAEADQVAAGLEALEQLVGAERSRRLLQAGPAALAGLAPGGGAA